MIQPNEPQFKPGTPRDTIEITSADITEINIESDRKENEKSNGHRRYRAASVSHHEVRGKTI